MIIPPGLQFLTQLILDHGTDRAGEALLIPCLHEELEEDINLLHAGVQRCGGTLFFLSGPDTDWEAPSGPISSDRHALVQGMLDAAGEALPRKVIIERDGDGRIHARLDGDKLPIEPSLIPILRAAAIIASSAYDEYDLIVMATMAAPTDPRRRDLLWSLLTLDPIDLGLKGRPTTVVPILGTSLDPETDFLRVPDIRYVVRWDRVIRRSALSQELSIKDIADLAGRPLVLFLGAGASASSGIPLGNHYRDLALEGLVGSRDSSQAAAEAFFDLLRERQHLLPTETSRSSFAAELTLERVLLETFKALGVRPRTDAPVIQEIIRDCEAALDYVRPGRKAIRELAAKLRGQLIIITVNFDQLIEQGLGVDCSVYYRPEHYRERLGELVAYAEGDASKPIPVLKLHGSIEDPESLIATIDTTSAGFDDHVRTALNELLAKANGPMRWVWIGCSMRDRDVNLWLGGLGASALDEWWVDPLPGQSLHDFFVQHREPKWNQRGQLLVDRLIVDSADGFLRTLADRIATT